jgi:chromosome segregation ATPase
LAWLEGEVEMAVEHKEVPGVDPDSEVTVHLAAGPDAFLQRRGLNVFAVVRDEERQRVDTGTAASEAAALRRVKAAVEEATRDMRRDIDMQKVRVEKLNARIDKQDARIDKQDARIKTLEREDRERHARIAALTGEMHTLKATVDGMQRHIQYTTR